MNEYKNRSEVPEEYRVTLKDMYQSDDEWYQEYKKIMEDYSNFSKYKGKMHKADELYQFLNEVINVDNQITNLYIYAQVSHDADLLNEKYTIIKNKIMSLNANFNQIVSFFFF